MTTGQKKEEEIERINNKRKQNREDKEKLAGKLLSFGDEYVIQLPITESEDEWTDQKDLFRIRNERFEEDGRLISSEDRVTSDHFNKLPKHS